MKKRSGYIYIQHRENKENIVVSNHILSADALKELEEATNVIFQLQPIVFSLDEVERSYQELITSIKVYQSNLNKLGEKNLNLLPFLDALEGKLSISRKITNFLSSASAFLYRTKHQLQYIHGKNSKEFEAWEELRKKIHATSFSYRFMYELRNFTQHRSFPFNKYGAKGKLDSESKNMTFEIEIMVVRDQFLDTEKKTNYLKYSREDIQKQLPEFDLLPFITEYLHHLRQLCLEPIWFQSMRLSECLTFFEKITSKNPERVIPVIFIGESKSKDFPPDKCELIPIKELKYILHEFDRLINVCGDMNEQVRLD